MGHQSGVARAENGFKKRSLPSYLLFNSLEWFAGQGETKNFHELRISVKPTKEEKRNAFAFAFFPQ